jgi:hypothetical protein
MRVRHFAVACALLVAVYAHASSPFLPPIVTITAPTGTVFSSSWPVSAPITVRIQTPEGEEIGDVTNVSVSVNAAATVANNLNPWAHPSNLCNAGTLPVGVTCTSANVDDGSITVPFSVDIPGSYIIAASAKYRGQDGSFSETVSFLTLSVEYPAPPSVANAYLNTPALKPLMTGKQRGCVVSMIALKHAQLSAYGPKGGPYNEAMIQNDASNFLSQCPK